jgi:hypothetical protein
MEEKRAQSRNNNKKPAGWRIIVSTIEIFII